MACSILGEDCQGHAQNQIWIHIGRPWRAGSLLHHLQSRPELEKMRCDLTPSVLTSIRSIAELEQGSMSHEAGELGPCLLQGRGQQGGKSNHSFNMGHDSAVSISLYFLFPLPWFHCSTYVLACDGNVLEPGFLRLWVPLEAQLTLKVLRLWLRWLMNRHLCKRNERSNAFAMLNLQWKLWTITKASKQ